MVDMQKFLSQTKWLKDSERRDFTFNAIYLDRKGNIFDPQSGIKDLRE